MCIIIFIQKKEKHTNLLVHCKLEEDCINESFGFAWMRLPKSHQHPTLLVVVYCLGSSQLCHFYYMHKNDRFTDFA